MADLEALVTLSQAVGSDVLLVQGGGGNTSLKAPDGRRMWIKASGLRLGDLRREHGWVEADLPALRAVMADPALRALPPGDAHAEAARRVQAAVVGPGGLRPSLETTFHAVLGLLVLHTHPVYVNAFTCLAGGQDALAEALGKPFLWVPYAAPGFALGVAVAAAWERPAEDPNAWRLPIVLANHGLIAHGPEAGPALRATELLAQAGERCFGAVPWEALGPQDPPARLAEWASGLDQGLRATSGQQAGCGAVRPARRAALAQAAREPERWLAAGPLVPDDVVYGGRRGWVAEPETSPADWLADHPEAWQPLGKMVVAVRGLGVVLAGPSAAFLDAMEENLLAHVLVRWLIARRRGAAQPLAAREVEYLVQMEEEHYRQAVAAQRLS